jgi:hypothetical protein
MSYLEITDHLTECVEKEIPVSFSKYGDGEYNCAVGGWGWNCDNDRYTHQLGTGLKESFKYMSNHAENAYMGIWHDHKHCSFWESLAEKPVKWANYHTILFDKNNEEQKIRLYKAIKASKMKKIIVCNDLLIKSKFLFNANYLVHVPFNNWFEGQFTSILDYIKQLIGDSNRPPLVITCCGMNAKVLICELYKAYPAGIYLDFGSALDLICTKRDSRGREYTYDYLSLLLQELLPADWENDKWNGIYEQARYKMGVHMGDI